MAKRKARDDEVAAAPRKSSAAMKRRRTTTRTTTSSTLGICDDVLRSIFARVPARTAVASMALSKHHRRLMRCPDFTALHCRLAPPLPLPHVAYVATAKVRKSGSEWGCSPASVYHGFHVAGGAGLGSGNAPMRALAGPMYLLKRYVNTCNGVVLLAGGRPGPTTCVLWNPAIADEEKEVTVVPVSASDYCDILALGYGAMSKTYKLLLTRRLMKSSEVLPPFVRYTKELLVCTLGGGGGVERKNKPLLRTVLSGEGVVGEFTRQSLYMDGTIYLLHIISESATTILAFDVDSETVTNIGLPEPRHAISNKLMEVSGRPCLNMYDRRPDRRSISLWLLNVQRRWERRCLIILPDDDEDDDHYSITGVWDCGGGVLFMYLHQLYHPVAGGGGKLYIYRVATKAVDKAKLLYNLSPEEGSHYALCWGYKPTLVSPGSIVGELSQEEERPTLQDCTAEIMEALKPLSGRDKRKGKKATLDIVCFIEFLVRIMQKLPENVHDVLRMPLLNSDAAADSDSESDY